jgi:ABC-2 type transport system ATP-binding protein
MTAVLKSQRLGKRYGRHWALSDCTLEIPAGRVVGLVGPNGAGKSTLLNLAAGQLTPTSGSIEVPVAVPPVARRSWPRSASSPRTPPPTSV